MKDLVKLAALYSKIDSLLEVERFALTGQAISRIEASQVLNDQAYFILCWGQLELEIDTRCRDAVRRRRSSSDWQIRRAWDLYNPDEPRFSGLSFEDRAKLVLDGQAGKGSAYAKTKKHYDVRNRIAHGKLELTRIDVTAFVQDCYVIQAVLHRSG